MQKFFESVRIAMRALAANKLRSILTMLGIIIGVGAVIALMSLGRGVEKYITEQFAGLGSNLLFVFAGGGDGPPDPRRTIQSMTISDMDALGDRFNVPDVGSVGAEITRRLEVSHNEKSETVEVHGVTTSFFSILNWELEEGSLLTDTDFEERGRVAVLGDSAYRDLFELDEYPIGQTVRINNLPFRIIGLLKSKGGGIGGDQDNSIFLPLSTAQDRIFRSKTVSGDYQVDVVYASVIDAERTQEAQDQISEVLRARRGVSYLDSDNFSIVSQMDIISVFGDIIGALTIFLGAIAGISLLVGGIGIMNIMLVSVTERTREIGLRKAVGAKRRDVLFQFLVEAVTLAVIGGALGILLGVVGAYAASSFSDSFTAVVGMDAILTSLIFSMVVGLFFGIYPAYRASRLNPIDALRYE